MKLKAYWVVLLFTLGFVACKDEVQPINEEEVINEVEVFLTAPDQSVYSFRYFDADGDFSGTPVITADRLPANTSFDGRIVFTNSLVQPAEDITAEVREEGEEHQLFFLINGVYTPDITYRDTDNNGLPIGLEFSMTTGDAIHTTFTVVLRHQPNKTASGVKEGDPTNAGGETDVQIDFPLVVE